MTNKERDEQTKIQTENRKIYWKSDNQIYIKKADRQENNNKVCIVTHIHEKSVMIKDSKNIKHIFCIL